MKKKEGEAFKKYSHLKEDDSDSIEESNDLKDRKEPKE